MKTWQKKGLLAWLLFPIGLLYQWVSFIRHQCYQLNFFSTYHAPVPVIVIGNITVGGTGKTPLVIALTHQLLAAGYKVGIVSRGYKSQADHYPYIVTQHTSASLSGDEALLISYKTGRPVVIDPDRPRAIQKLLATFDCDIIISDDGLQHYAMERDIEIAVVDGVRQLGNGWCLPAGPLREGRHRLKDVDVVVANGKAKANEVLMRLIPGDAYQLGDMTQSKPLSAFTGQSVNAMAGIGDPSRFFTMLETLGITLAIRKPLVDHHLFIGDEFNFDNDYPIFITEKDAVKCQDIHLKHIWVIPIDAELPSTFYQAVERLLSYDKPK